jgi:hypothetical protein
VKNRDVSCVEEAADVFTKNAVNWWLVLLLGHRANQDKSIVYKGFILLQNIKSSTFHITLSISTIITTA